MKLPKQSLTNLADTRDVALCKPGKYSNMYEVWYKGVKYFEVVHNTTFEVVYRTESYYFAVQRWIENNEE